MSGARPPLPDECSVPQSVTGWQYDAEAPTNGHAWYGPNRETSVVVRSSAGGSVRVCVHDERVSGFGNRVEIDTLEGFDRSERPAVVARGVGSAREWMGTTAPEEWSHPGVSESVFDAPAGYALERYYLESRETIVYYRRTDVDVDEKSIGCRAVDPDEYTRENCAYLYLHVWNGSGNATVALAPWMNAHGPGSKHPELREIVETPDECGLEVAVAVAREWAGEFVDDGGMSDPRVGQSNLGWFGGEPV